MALEPKIKCNGELVGGASEWKYIQHNALCPGCGKIIYSYEEDIEYSKTKRGTHVFWHTGCTGKVRR